MVQASPCPTLDCMASLVHGPVARSVAATDWITSTGAGQSGVGERWMFSPLFARTRTVHRPLELAAYDCVKVIVIRDDSAIVHSEFGQRFAREGDVLLFGANVLWGGEPEGHIAVTTVYLDPDYVVDELFWRYADRFSDRLEARELVCTLYADAAQLLHLGAARVGRLMPWLDELAGLSSEDGVRTRFHRMQAL